MNSSPAAFPPRLFPPRPVILPRWPALIFRHLWAAAFAGFFVTATMAQQTTVSGGGVITQQYSGPPATPPPRPETPDSGPSLGKEGARPYSVYRNYPSANTRYRGSRPSGLFFLPTIPPVLGTTPSANPTPLAAGYPREFVGEPFFMAYGNLTANNLLSPKRAERIARFRAARLSLLTELREQLSNAQGASIEARERALAGFAANQTPRLLELEAEAEKIRQELTRVELFSTPAEDIGDLPSTKDFEARGFAGAMAPVDDPSDLQPHYEVPERRAALASWRLFLSCAYFRDGFSPEQRRLLDEMALDTQLLIEPDTGTPSVFFWPAGARIPVPVGLAPEAAAKWEEFQRRKAALKDELRATLSREEKRIFNVDSTETYAQLAAVQASRFVELDALADQIRPALAARADAAARSSEKLPADLARQIAAIADRKAALQREMFTRLKEFRHELPEDHIELTLQNNGLAIAVTTENGHGRTREAVLTRINAFNDEISGRFISLAADYDTARAAIARYQATASGVSPGVTVDQLATDFLAAYHVRECRDRQRDYASAVLASGLSPAQRRMLLAAAAGDLLEQPLSSVP